MGADDKVLAWLSRLDFDPLRVSQSLAPSRDLAFSVKPNSTNGGNRQPLSPPDSHRKRSIMASDPDQTPKRRRVHDRNTEDDDTPRVISGIPRQRNYSHFRTTSPSSLPPPSEPQSTPSHASGRSSPTKQIAALELDPGGVETRVLSVKDRSLPAALSRLLLEFEFCSNGVGIVPRDLEPTIKEKAREDPDFYAFLPHVYTADESATFGPVPPIDEVTKIVVEAAEAQNSRQNEAGWNMMVHWPLLDNAIYGRRRTNQLVGVACCTTAKIIKEYLPTSSQAKMVDFGIYVLPDSETSMDAAEAVENLRRILPCNVINHTDFVSLRDRPLAISIESKKRNSSNAEAAELQLGTWHAAQWKFLGDLVQRNGGSLDGLPFLPAIIVQGHDWSFVATTREGQKTILWVEKSFGSTSSSLGVFKTIWGVQRLANWVKEVFWPWYRVNVLGI